MASKSVAGLRFSLARQCLSTALFLILLPLSLHAATLPPLVVPEGLGINTHFVRGNENELDLIAAAGIRVVRTDFKWDETERYLGVYDWSAHEELAANLAKRGIRPLFVLDYSNALYEETTPKLLHGLWFYREVMSPRSPSSVAAFARWAAAAERHFSKYQVIWEIWNEPNIKFWKPAPAVADYTRLALATCQAIHAVNPNATVIGPASSSFPWTFMEYMFKAGALNCLDGVSVHPYRKDIPETVRADYTQLRKLINQCTSAQRGKSIPILNSEWGYSTVQSGLHPDDQAALAVRLYLTNLLNGVPISIWYDWKNDGENPTSGEHNFGIVRTNLEPKPAYGALKVMSTQLGGYHFVERLKLDSDRDYALLFANNMEQYKIAAWTTVREHTVRIAVPKPPPKVILTDGRGNQSEIILDGGFIPLKLVNLPVYLSP